MTWLQFVSSVASTLVKLAWPVLVLVLAVKFRTELKSVFTALAKRMAHLKSVKGPAGMQVDFEEKVLEAREEAAVLSQNTPQPELSLPLPPVPSHIGGGQIPAGNPPETDGVPREELFAMAKRSPHETILRSWAHLEETIRRVTGTQRIPPVRALRELDALGTPDGRDLIGIVKDLSSLRNRAAHQADFKISSLVALDYALTCYRAEQLVRWYAGKTPNRTGGSPSSSPDQSPASTPRVKGASGVAARSSKLDP